MNTPDLQLETPTTTRRLVYVIRPLVVALGVGALLLGLWLTPRPVGGPSGTASGPGFAVEQVSGMEESSSLASSLTDIVRGAWGG
jgi:hypothetical protein